MDRLIFIPAILLLVLIIYLVVTRWRKKSSKQQEKEKDHERAQIQEIDANKKAKISENIKRKLLDIYERIKKAKNTSKKDIDKVKKDVDNATKDANNAKKVADKAKKVTKHHKDAKEAKVDSDAEKAYLERLDKANKELAEEMKNERIERAKSMAAKKLADAEAKKEFDANTKIIESIKAGLGTNELRTKKNFKLDDEKTLCSGEYKLDSSTRDNSQVARKIFPKLFLSLAKKIGDDKLIKLAVSHVALDLNIVGDKAEYRLVHLSGSSHESKGVASPNNSVSVFNIENDMTGITSDYSDNKFDDFRNELKCDGMDDSNKINELITYLKKYK